MTRVPVKTSLTNFKFISKIFRLAIFIFCLTFVIWQANNCLNKFLEKPIGTTVSSVNQNEVEFPIITICPISVDEGYKWEILQYCS